MIINDFYCEDCEETIIDQRYKYEDKDKLKCPSCDSGNLSVRLSAPAIRTLNTREKVSHALKKRTVSDHNENKKDRLEKAKNKHPKFF